VLRRQTVQARQFITKLLDGKVLLTPTRDGRRARVMSCARRSTPASFLRNYLSTSNGVPPGWPGGCGRGLRQRDRALSFQRGRRLNAADSHQRFDDRRSSQASIRSMLYTPRPMPSDPSR
jgi:hypothetical protein